MRPCAFKPGVRHEPRPGATRAARGRGRPAIGRAAPCFGTCVRERALRLERGPACLRAWGRAAAGPRRSVPGSSAFPFQEGPAASPAGAERPAPVRAAGTEVWPRGRRGGPGSPAPRVARVRDAVRGRGPRSPLEGVGDFGASVTARGAVAPRAAVGRRRLLGLGQGRDFGRGASTGGVRDGLPRTGAGVKSASRFAKRIPGPAGSAASAGPRAADEEAEPGCGARGAAGRPATSRAPERRLIFSLPPPDRSGRAEALGAPAGGDLVVGGRAPGDSPPRSERLAPPAHTEGLRPSECSSLLPRRFYSGGGHCSSTVPGPRGPGSPLGLHLQGCLLATLAVGPSALTCTYPRQEAPTFRSSLGHPSRLSCDFIVLPLIVFLHFLPKI
ncbi:PREDICTED: collagen alpha-1(III) chain-like [Chinchilla lanigera]|uniref:collagen alpha-1(III) chain-like n=1 Tax=Chinchilla lanigera TaxID=34839 RepID=UPI00038EDE9F|nr:PREDICTED: collagen alpha-1(III) chain-like [Chinchilla lanigera]